MRMSTGRAVHAKAEKNYPIQAQKEIAELEATIAELTNADLTFPPLKSASFEDAKIRRNKALGRLIESREKFKRMEEKLTLLKRLMENSVKEIERKVECVQESNRLHFIDSKVHFRPGLADELERRLQEQDNRIRRLELLALENERSIAGENVGLLEVQQHLNKMQETMEALAEVLYELPSNVLFQEAKKDFEEKQNL